MPFAPTTGFDAGFPSSINLSRTWVSSIGEGQRTFLTVDTLQWYDAVTLIRGAHTLKFGANLRKSRTTIEIGIPAFSTCTILSSMHRMIGVSRRASP